MNRRYTPLVMGLFAVGFLVLLVLGLRSKGGKPDKAQQQAQQQPPRNILVAKNAVPQGRKVSLDDVGAKAVPEDQVAKLVPTDAIQDMNLLVGGTAKTAIQPGDFFTAANLDPAPKYASQKIEPGFVAVTIPAPPTPSLYDLKFLSPDDRVDVFGVSQDTSSGQTVSVRLASNVRVLAVDKDLSREQAEKARRDLEAKKAELEQKKKTAQSGTAPPNPEVLKSYDEQIAAIDKQLNGKPENPSVTVEVTPAQSQSVALWRKTAEVQLALHRQEDAQQVVFDTSVGYLNTTGAPGEAGKPRPGQLLTLDDVVPLDQRDPAKYVERMSQLDAARDKAAQKEVDAAERRVHLAELQVEYRNLLRYGVRNKPPAPSVPPISSVPPMTVRGDGDAQRLRTENERLRAEAAKAARSGAAAQAPLTRSIEVYRGKDKTVVSY